MPLFCVSYEPPVEVLGLLLLLLQILLVLFSLSAYYSIRSSFSSNSASNSFDIVLIDAVIRKIVSYVRRENGQVRILP